MATASKKKATRKKATRKTAAKAAKKATRKAASEPRTVQVAIASESNIRDVADLYQQLADVVKEASEVTLDVSAVDRIDTSVMQTLLGFVLERRRQSLETRWHDPSEAFLKAVGTIDLSAHLGLEGER